MYCRTAVFLRVRIVIGIHRDFHFLCGRGLGREARQYWKIEPLGLFQRNDCFAPEKGEGG